MSFHLAQLAQVYNTCLLLPNGRRRRRWKTPRAPPHQPIPPHPDAATVPRRPLRHPLPRAAAKPGGPRGAPTATAAGVNPASAAASPPPPAVSMPSPAVSPPQHDVAPPARPSIATSRHRHPSRLSPADETKTPGTALLHPKRRRAVSSSDSLPSPPSPPIKSRREPHFFPHPELKLSLSLSLFPVSPSL